MRYVPIYVPTYSLLLHLNAFIFSLSCMYYLNYLSTSQEFDTLRNQSWPFMIYKYSPRCRICLENLSHIYLWLKKTDYTSLYHVNVVEHPELKQHITTLVETPHQSPQLIIINNKNILGSRNNKNIQMDVIEKVLEKEILG